MAWGLKATALAAALSWASDAQAITLIFDWSSFLSEATTDTSLAASGQIELDATAGEVFSEANLVSLSLSVTGDSIVDFTLTDAAPTVVIEGRVADDGQSASLRDFFVGDTGIPSFGCDFENCAQFDGYNIASGRTPDGVLATTRYSNPRLALLSMQLSLFTPPEDPVDNPDPGQDTGGSDDLSPIPLPGSAPLLFAALAGLAIWRRRPRDSTSGPAV